MNDKKNIEEEGIIDPFPISIIEMTRGDIEGALWQFDEETQKIIIDINISWDAPLLKRIKIKLREELMPDYSTLLHYAIKDALKDMIEEANTKRTFIRGLRDYFLKKRKEEINKKKK